MGLSRSGRPPSCRARHDTSFPDYHTTSPNSNRRAPVFLDPQDYRVYLALIRKYSSKYALKILAYVLMPNHIHLVAIPQSPTSMAQTLGATHTGYATYFNRRYGKTGHLWQGRYFSCALDEPHLWAAVRYVERNPVRAGLVARAEDYPWSSAQAHCGLRHDPVLSESFRPPGAIAGWPAWLDGEVKQDSQRIRRKTEAGLPCGSEGFLGKIRDQKGTDPQSGSVPNASIPDRT